MDDFRPLGFDDERDREKIILQILESQGTNNVLGVIALCQGIEFPDGLDAQYDLAKVRLLSEAV